MVGQIAAERWGQAALAAAAMPERLAAATEMRGQPILAAEAEAAHLVSVLPQQAERAVQA